jgi:hypothetical protein
MANAGNPQASVAPQGDQTQGMRGGMINTLGQQSDQGIGGNIARISSLMGGGYPQQPIAQPQAPNIYQQSAGAYTQAVGKAATPTAMGDVSQYYNPYESQVVDTTLADIERSRLMAQNQLGAQATQAGAYGGSRQGIAESETNRAYADQAARTAAQLRQQGYTQAQDIALRDVGVGLQQAQQLGSLSNLGFGMGQGIQQQQMQQGLQQQVLNQALIDAARQQYAGYTGAPMGSLQAPLAALGVGGDLGQRTLTETKSGGGVLDYITAFAGMPNEFYKAIF